MHIYEVYYNPDHKSNKLVLLRPGFSFVAAIFNFFWAGYKGMWAIFGIGILIYFSLYNFSTMHMQSIIKLSVFIFFGFFANDLLSYYLEHKGYKLYDIVLANSMLEGEYKFYQKNAKLL